MKTMVTVDESDGVRTEQELRQLAAAQAKQQEYKILRAMRQDDEAHKARTRRIWKQMNILLSANGAPVVMHDTRSGERIKDVEVEIVDTESKPVPKQLPPPKVETTG